MIRTAPLGALLVSNIGHKRVCTMGLQILRPMSFHHFSVMNLFVIDFHVLELLYVLVIRRLKIHARRGHTDG